MTIKYKSGVAISSSDVGVGYSSDKTMITSIKCLKDYPTRLIGKPSSISMFVDADSEANIAKDLDLGVSGTFPVFPLITGSISLSYSRSVQEDKYSKNFNYLYQVHLGNEIIAIDQYGPAVLNDFGLAAYKAGPQAFRESCGDQFVAQEALGARLYVTMQLTFTSTADKTSFAAGFGGKIDLLALIVSVQAQYKLTIERQNINLNLAITAYQEGGDVVRLANILTKSADGSYYAIDCDIKNMEPCQEVISGIINYAKYNLITQVGYEDNMIVGYPSSLGSVYVPYERLGLFSGNSTITPEISQIRTRLLSNYSTLLEEKKFLENLLYNSKFQNVSNNDTTNTGLGYKEFDVNLNTVAPMDSSNLNATSYWSWTPDSIFTAMKFTLQTILNYIGHDILLLESKEAGILSCYQDPETCKPIDLIPIAYETTANFKTAYQIISVCNNTPFGRYALPVYTDIYQEQAKFEFQNNTLYTDAKYKLIKIDDKLSVSLFNDELSRSTSPCAILSASQDSDTVLVYTGDLTSPSCVKAFCPNLINASGLLPAHMIFIEVDSPL